MRFTAWLLRLVNCTANGWNLEDVMRMNIITHTGKEELLFARNGKITSKRLLIGRCLMDIPMI